MRLNARTLAGLVLVLAGLSLAGCVNFDEQVKDDTRLEGHARGDLGRTLFVSVANAYPALAAKITEAVQSELEGGDLFDEVVAADAPVGSDALGAPAASGTAPVTSELRPARLLLALERQRTDVVDDFWRQREGYVVRYELACRLVDRTGTDVLHGTVAGIGYDDATEVMNLTEAKREDIRCAARRDAASKVGRILSKLADERARDALEKLARLRLPPGVGPVPIAALGFDDDPAARRRRGLQLARATSSALQRLGPDLAVVSQDEVEQELGADPSLRPRSFETLRSDELDRMVPRLGARLYVVGKVSADGNRVEAHAWIKTTALENVGEAHAVAEGPGALGLVAVELAQKLGECIQKKPPEALPKKEENE